MNDLARKKESAFVENCETGSVTLESLFNKYHRQLYQIAYRLTYSRHDAEDVVQEVFVKLHHKMQQFSGEAALATWLYRITVNASLDNMRRYRKRPKASLSAIHTEAILFEQKQSWVSGEVSQKLDTALKKLKPRYRAVIILREFEEMSYEEISAIMEINLGTVASRLNRAYKKLKRELEKLGIDQHYLKS